MTNSIKELGFMLSIMALNTITQQNDTRHIAQHNNNWFYAQLNDTQYNYTAK